MSNINEADISGIVFTVSKGGGTGANFPKLDLMEDEWYPAKLTKIEKVARPGSADGRIKPGEGLNWTFELIGDEYAVQVEDKKYQQRIIGRTSMTFSSNPERPSKLYQWYCKLTGKVPADGSKITLGSLVGMGVEIMVKKSPGKDKNGNAVVWHNVEKLKPAAGAKVTTPASTKPTPAPKQVVKPAPAPVVNSNPGGVTTPEEIPDDIIEEATETPAAEGDLYKDVF